MEFVQGFNRMMEGTKFIALATSVDNVPNVRIVSFCCDTQKRVVYFSTVKGSPKTLEFPRNNKVAFTTIPVGTNEHVRVAHGLVRRSDFTIYDLKGEFVKKNPKYEATIAQAGDRLDVYEIHFSQASVTLGFDKKGRVNL